MYRLYRDLNRNSISLNSKLNPDSCGWTWVQVYKAPQNHRIADIIWGVGTISTSTSIPLKSPCNDTAICHKILKSIF